MGSEGTCKSYCLRLRLAAAGKFRQNLTCRILYSTTSSEAGSVASNLHCVTALAMLCIASATPAFASSAQSSGDARSAILLQRIRCRDELSSQLRKSRVLRQNAEEAV